MGKQNPQKKTFYVNGIIVGEMDATGDFQKDMEAFRQFLRDKGLHKEVTKVQAMFRQALSFATTAAHLYERDLIRAPRNMLSVAPFVVNSVFSIELYLRLFTSFKATLHGVMHFLSFMINSRKRPVTQ
ncbi:MAG: hypothetical protein ABIP81_01120 [Terriglobales bacterium]